MKNIKIIIPARYKSTRFPGKPLALIQGIPMVIRVANIANKIISKKQIIIATDSKEIESLAKSFNYQSQITSKNCLTGTDRVAEVALKDNNTKIFINIQGDEPLIKSSDIKKIINAKKQFKNDVICGFSKIKKSENPKDKSIPKIVINEKNQLIYISRSLIPGSKYIHNDFFKQVCIYGFSKKQLLKFYNMRRKSKLEQIEDIEILRFFELNEKIKMVRLSASSLAVDYPKDIKKIEKQIKKK